MSEVNLPTCVTVGEGHVISLRVLDAKRENKVGSFTLSSHTESY